jgi:hypothetical protein
MTFDEGDTGADLGSMTEPAHAAIVVETHVDCHIDYESKLCVHRI